MAQASTPTTTAATTSTTTTTTSSPNTRESPETAQWTKYLPEAFGIRENVRNSPYRWCVRESSLWGIATGTAMALHRFRMKSSPGFAIHVGFATMFLVSVPSYYLCVKKRDYKERLIELMMRANDFQEAKEMPPQAPAGDEHPFLEPAAADDIIPEDDMYTGISSSPSSSSFHRNSDGRLVQDSEKTGDTNRPKVLVDREFVAHLPERKEWQKQVPQQDAKDVFVEKQR